MEYFLFGVSEANELVNQIKLLEVEIDGFLTNM